MISAAAVAEKLSLPGIGVEVATRFRDKFVMRSTASGSGVKSPPFLRVDDTTPAVSVLEHLRFPLIVKPTDGLAGAAVRTADSPESLRLAIQLALSSSRSSAAIVEEKLTGTEITIEAVVIEGTCHVLAISDKDHFQSAPTVASRITYPANVSAKTRERVVEAHQRIVHSLGMQNGMTHAEYFLVDDQVFLIEVAARGGGSRIYTHAVPHHSGYDTVRSGILQALGETIPIPAASKNRHVNIGFFEFPTGKVTQIAGLEEIRQLPFVVDLYCSLSLGSTVAPIQDDRSRAVQVVVIGDSRNEVLDRTEQVRQMLTIETQ